MAFFSDEQLILYPSSEKAGAQREHTGLQVNHNINVAFSFLHVFSLNLMAGSHQEAAIPNEEPLFL